MKKPKSKKPLREYKKDSKSSVRRRIKELFDQAEVAAKTSMELASYLVKRAYKISLVTRVKLSKEYRRRFCKNCNAYLISGKNATIRTQRGKVVITCKECKHITRIPYSKKD